MHLIFLPGASGSTAFWQPLIGELPDALTGRIVAYPGFGNAPVHETVNNFEDLIHHVLAKIDRPCVLVAQSLGGIFAVAAAVEKPELVQGLVLIATSGGIDLSRFRVQNWRPDYAKQYAGCPDWFMTAKVARDDLLSSIRKPVLLIWGDSDDISPVPVGNYLATQLRDAQLKIIAGGRHDPAEVRAKDVAHHIKDYLSRIGYVDFQDDLA